MPKIVLIGCTHGYHDHVVVSAGDILVHTGDFSSHGQFDDTVAFLRWFSAQPHAHKVLVAGNHDWLTEKDPGVFARLLGDFVPSVTYLQDSGATVMGLRFW